MKILGMIGGIGPESTIEYYRHIIAMYREQRPDGSYPAIIINSIDAKRMLDLIGQHQLSEVTGLLVAEVQRLARAGADFALLAANTPHIIFDELRRRSPIRLVSIVQATCDEARSMGMKKVGLIGTRFTMQGRFYPDVFAKEGLAIVIPNAEEQAYIHEKYIGELVNGIVKVDTRKQILAIGEQMKERDGIQGLILGGTELSILMGNVKSKNLPLLDTTEIHARAAVARLLS